MSTTEMLVQLKEILGYPLFTVSNVNINTATILVFVLLIGTAVVVSWLVRKAIRRSFYARGVTADGTIGATNRLAHYAVMLIGIGIALDTVGINLNALFAAGAIFAVAIGFAMRNIVENFISGIILLVERVLKPGDVIDVDGQRVKIVDMRIRTTVGRTRDGEDIIIPNGILVQSMVKNQTMRDRLHRVHVLVGVEYDSDMKVVRNTLERVAADFEERHDASKTGVAMMDFADSAVVWRVVVWTVDPFDAGGVAARLREKIWWALKEADVTIAYPQLDVHLDAPVEKALSAIGRT